MKTGTATWESKKLGDVVTLKRGYDLPHRLRRPGCIPIISSSGVTGFHDTAKVAPPGVVTGRYGTLGEVFYASEPFWPLNTTLYVQDFHGNDPRFVSYLLRTLGFDGRSGAAAVPGINRNHLHQLPLVLPPPSEQRRIAAVLLAYDELIENNARRVEILEEMARAIYREWFVATDLPRQRLDSIALIYRGRSYRGSDLVDCGGLPFVNLKCIDRDGGFRRDGIKRYDGPAKLDQRVQQGDVVVGVTDMTQERRIVGRAARVPSMPDGPGVISMDLVKIEPTVDGLGAYLYASLRYTDFGDTVKQFANGANVLHLHPDRIAEYLLPVPGAKTLDHFNQQVDPMYQLIDVLADQSDNLAAQRDLLLPRLVSGEIDVSTLDLDTSRLAS
jgi:type I restriction enzyme S subunit